MTANANDLYEEEVSNQVFHGLAPSGDGKSRCANGDEAPDGMPARVLAHVANIVLSAAAGTVVGALNSATHWGLAGGTFGTGALAYLAAVKHLSLLMGGQQYMHIPGGNLAAYQPEPGLISMLPQFMAAGISLGGVSGGMYGAVRGLWNAPYEEYFGTADDQEAEVVGVCGAADGGY